MIRAKRKPHLAATLTAATFLLMTGFTGTASAGPLDPIIAIELNIQSGEPQPPSITLPVWNSTYDWPNVHGYNTWTANKQTSLPDGYEMRQGYQNRPGLWMWPKGSYSLGGLFPKLYPPGYVEFSFSAPGTTRIARAKLDTEYRNSLYLSHCTEFGLRNGTTSRAKNRNCSAPVPDRVEVGTSGERAFRKVSLFDPSGEPTAKDLYARLDIPRCPPLPDSACSKLIASLDPLTAGAFMRIGKVELTLVDDDLPIVTTSGSFYDLRGRHIDGKSSYPLAIAASDAGSGIKLTRLDHTAPGGSEVTLGSKSASCDLTHSTAQLGSRICPPSDLLSPTVNTNSFPEGTHAFRAWAADAANNVTEKRWNVAVDRTAPATPADLYFLTPAKGAAQVYWDEAVDPMLADGTRSSGTTNYRFRSKINGGAWSGWSEVSRSRQLSSEIVDQDPGTVVTFEVVAVDAVGNVSDPSTMSGVVHDPDEDTLPGGTGNPDDPAPGASAPATDEGAEADSGSPSNIPTGAVPISLHLTNGSSPPAIAPGIWNSSYPWQQSSGYNEWTPNVQSALTNGYELKRGYGGRPGLWIWPVGSPAAGDNLYPPGYAEFAFTAPGTTRIARASVDLAYRSALYTSHCTEIGLRTRGETRDRDTDCLAPIPDRVVIDSHGETAYRNVPLFDPATNPTAKQAYARIFVPSCTLLSIELCSKLIPTQDPLHFGPYLQVQRADMTLVDDDRPTVQTLGSLADLNGKYVAGNEAYELEATAADAGAGIASAQIDHTSPAPSSQQQTLGTESAPCDPSHGTLGLGARICPASDSMTIPVDTTPFPEGRNRIRVWSADPAGNVGERRLSLIVDRTAPAAPRVRPLRPDEGSAQIYWDESIDPVLPDGTRGAGIDRYRFRSKIGSGDWTAWKSVSRSQQSSEEVFDQPAGTIVSFEVVADDGVGNSSAISSASVTVRGKHPTNSIGGALGELDGEYTQGTSAVNASLHAVDDEAGVGSVSLGEIQQGLFNEVVAAPCVNAGQRLAPGKNSCPRVFQTAVGAPLPDFAEGAHTFRAVSTDRANNPSAESQVTTFIDRTPPPPVQEITAYYDEEFEDANVTWTGVTDPALPDGTAGSGIAGYRYRYQRAGQGISGWETTDEDGFTLSDASLGEEVLISVSAFDAIGNESAPQNLVVKVNSQEECGDTSYDDGDDAIDASLHVPTSGDASIDSFTFANAKTQASLLSRLPNGVRIVSAIERTKTMPGEVHTGGISFASGLSMQQNLAIYNDEAFDTIDDLEDSYQGELGTETPEVRAQILRELDGLAARRAKYATSGGPRIKSFAVAHNPPVAAAIQSEFSGELVDPVVEESDFADECTESNVGSIANLVAGSGQPSDPANPEKLDAPGATDPEPSPQLRTTAEPDRGDSEVGSSALSLSNTSVAEIASTKAKSNTFTPPRVRIATKSYHYVTTCNGVRGPVRRAMLRWRWGSVGRRSYWLKGGRNRKHGVEIQLAMNREGGGSSDWAWGLPPGLTTDTNGNVSGPPSSPGSEGDEIACIPNVWSSNAPCAYPDDYNEDNAKSEEFAVTIGQGCRPRSSTKKYYWRMYLLRLPDDSDRVTATVNAVHRAGHGGGAYSGVSERSYCNGVRGGVRGACYFEDSKTSSRYVYRASSDTRDSLVTDGSILMRWTPAR